MAEKSKVFISYSRTDTRVTMALARDLQASGVEVWMDREDITVGERWSTAIQHALDESDAMVLVLSPDSMESDNVEDEFTFFLDNRKPIVPVMVQPTRLHFQLHRLQWIDFTQGDRQKAFEELLRALHNVGVEFHPSEKDLDDPSSRASTISRLMEEIEREKARSSRRRRTMGALAAVLAIGVLIIIGLLTLRGGGQNIPPTVEYVTGRVDGPDVSLYELPSRDSRVLVETIPDGRPLIVRMRTPDERFLLVEFGQESGFVLTRDVIVEDFSQIGIFLSPTPQPTATVTQFITATPTVTPSPTPEVPMSPPADACLVTVAADAQPQSARLGPSSVLYTALDTIKPGEAFVATARTVEGWLYIGIGWIDRTRAGVTVNDEALCNALPDDPNLGPNRIRLFIKDLPMSQELRPRSTIATDGLTDEALTLAQTWNSYGGLLENLNQLLSVDANLLMSVIVDEAVSSGSSDPNDLLTVRFEADVFDSLLPKEQEVDFDDHFYVDPADASHHQFRVEKADPYMDYHGDNALEWQAFEIAREINPDAAIRALRFGEKGLLGDYHAQIGYITPQAMFDAFMANQSARVIGKLDYIKGNSLMLAALRFQNWQRFGELYDARVGATVAAEAQTNAEILSTLR